MGALTDLWKSERGLVAVILIIAVTVLACLGSVTFAEWREYTLYVFGGYTAAKTITSAVETHTEGKVKVAEATPAASSSNGATTATATVAVTP